MATTLFRYPPARRMDVTDRLHGTVVPDPYRWLEDGRSNAVRSWEAAQDELLTSVRQGWIGHSLWTRELRRLYGAALWSAPRPRGDRLFFAHRPAGAEHVVLMVGEGGDERPLLDVTRMDPSGRTVLDAWHPSWDGTLLAYQLSTCGTEDSVLRVMDVATGTDVTGPIDRVRRTSIGWLPGSGAFYYVRSTGSDDSTAGRRYGRRVFLHRVGSEPATDTEIFGSGKPATLFYAVAVSPCGRWLSVIAKAGAGAGTDLWIADLRQSPPERPALVPVHTGIQARTMLCFPAHSDGTDTLWLRTDLDAPRGRIVETTGRDPRPETWRTLVSPRPGAVLTDFVPLQGAGQARSMGLVSWTRQAVAELTLHDLTDGRLVEEVSLPGTGALSSLVATSAGEPGAWFCYYDHIRPQTPFRFDARTRALTAWPMAETAPVPDVRVRQSCYRARDGVEVPCFILSSHGSADRSRPTILTGYGGFGISMTPAYLPLALAWVRAGGVYVVSGLRGGGEHGEQWHQAGTGVHKQTVFDDLDAAADHLIGQGWTAPDRLGLLGGSNGGLLASAALTQHPEKYAAVACLAPLTDMVRYERFGRGPSWRTEYGSIENAEEFGALLAYSPYHHVRQDIDYPPVLFAIGENDTRVDPLHARKMCAALQNVPAGRGPVLLRIERGAGHGTWVTSKVIEHSSDLLAFFGSYLGLPGPEASR